MSTARPVDPAGTATGPEAPPGASDAVPAATPRDADGQAPVRIVDTPAVRVRHPADLVAVVLSAVGIALVVVLAVYARGTTTGVTSDVQDFESLLQRILFVNVAVVETLITTLVPIAVLAELAMRRLLRHAVESAIAGILALGAAALAGWALTHLGTPELRAAFSVWAGGQWTVTISPLLTGTAALLTVAGARNRRRTLGWSWNLVWVALGLALVTGIVTLPSALVTVLLGRLIGSAVRYVAGVDSERAYGDSLVAGIRRAGFTPVELVRIHESPGPGTTTASDGAAGATLPDHGERDLAAQALVRHSGHRVYAMTTADHERLDVVVLDGDRQVVGSLVRLWRSLRLRGIDGRAVVSLRQSAERTALLTYAAWAAGVRTPRLLALAEADDSMLLVQQHHFGAVPLRELPPESLSDEILDAAWEQLQLAHQAGLAHRALTSDVVLVDLEPPFVEPLPGSGTTRPPAVVLTGWDAGDVASSELARRVDVAQLLALLALRVGARRAVESAARVIDDDELAAIGPLLQTIALPRTTRDEARERKGVLAEVREALLAHLPEADVEPERLVRFGARTVLTLVFGIVAAWLIITRLNLADISGALTEAQPWWAAVSFGLGMVTFLGSALSLVAFSPVRLPLWRATLVQVAGSYVALVAPAGVGPAALNLRMLTRRGVTNTLAVASVGLVQVSQFITTLALLLVLSLASGRPMQAPSRTVVVAVVVVVLAVSAAMLVPVVRRWVALRTVPLWRQTWPRLVQLLGQPRRFALAIAGNLIMTIGYLGAFQASLAAFGRELPLIDLALIYLLGNTAGAIIPTPGGLGTVEASLALGLVNGGLNGAIAASVVVLFRALTYWARVPFGWAAMRSLQRSGEL